MVTKQIASFTKDLKPVSIMKQGKHKSAIELLDTSSSDDNDLSESEFEPVVTSDEPVPMNATKKSTPKRNTQNVSSNK